ncbi:Hypothetical_protein [Hexamita inflata]|uniref:Hypothetical_protein n=1 Tax=Hexamita inflata TaxID=28002 RepID=A0ABP1K1D4_9EUKA
MILGLSPQSLFISTETLILNLTANPKLSATLSTDIQKLLFSGYFLFQIMSNKQNPLGFILCVVQIRQNYLVFNINSILFHRVTETKPLKGVKKCLLIKNLLISSGTRIYNIKCVNARKASFNTCAGDVMVRPTYPLNRLRQIQSLYSLYFWQYITSVQNSLKSLQKYVIIM